MYVGGWESEPGFPQELLIPICPGPWSSNASWPAALDSGRSIQHPLLVLRACSLTGLVLTLVVPPSFISLGCSGSWTGQVSRPGPLVPAHPTPYGLALAEAGARPLPQECWGASLSLQPIQVPSPAGFLSHLYQATSLPQPVHPSSTFPSAYRLKGSGFLCPVWISFPPASWFGGPTQRFVGDPGQHLLCPLGNPVTQVIESTQPSLLEQGFPYS